MQSGTFDLEFQNASVVKAVGVKTEATAEGEEITSAEILEDKDTLIVKVVDLAYPGAGIEFQADIVNVGTIPAKIEAITPTKIGGNEDGVIKINGLEVLNTTHPTINVGEKCNVHFTVEWPAESEAQLTGEGETVEFSLTIEYTQDTKTVFDGKASHDGNVVENNPEEPTPEEPTLEYVNLAQTITVADYGKTINYSVTVNEVPLTDWKVLYNDGTNVQIILADYLPQTAVPQAALNAGLKKVTEDGEYSSSTYGVNSASTDRDTLVKGLTEGWEELAGGLEGATAVGTPTEELIENSFIEKFPNETSWKHNIAETDTLYVPHTGAIDGCWGYWLASPYERYANGVWCVGYGGYMNYGSYDHSDLGVRPVVSLPSSTLGAVGETITLKK